ncbi:hydrolase, NUDIX family [Mitsuokella sp. oral taxon 131 str. W9106]|nr:hydrolase, NUDIX family [Mitsuokella sp. oral taxon 131 str. W9106]
MTRYADQRGRDNYALVAGFTEIGETLEQTVQREVMEEVGLKVQNIRYYKSQPWGSAADILAGFYCDLDGCDSIDLDTSELRQAFWARPNEIRLQTDDWSLTNEMMKRFKEGEDC